MRGTKLSALLIILAIGSETASAGDIEDELLAIKARLQKMEQLVERQSDTIEHQNEIIEEKSKQIEELAENSKMNHGAGNSDSWLNKIGIGGVVEVEAAYNGSDSGENSSDIVLATAEINDWISAETVLLHEEDDTDLEVDISVVSIANPDGSWFVNAGLMYMPFGFF